MLANDLRVLVCQLNETIQRAAENGLQVGVEASVKLDTKGAATLYPVVSVRVLAEVQ